MKKDTLSRNKPFRRSPALTNVCAGVTPLHSLRTYIKKNIQYTNESVAGFTVVEIFAYIGMILVVLVLGYVSFSYFHTDYVLNRETASVIAVLDQAKIRSVKSKQHEHYGVYLGTSSMTFFKGSTYSPENPTNIHLQIHPLLLIVNISLQTGEHTIVFDPSGTTNDFGTLSLEARSNASIKSIISVKKTGEVAQLD